MSAKHEIFLPTPAIVIALGDFAECTAVQVRNIYLRSDPRRSLVTNFLSVEKNQDGAVSLRELDKDFEQDHQKRRREIIHG